MLGTQPMKFCQPAGWVFAVPLSKVSEKSTPPPLFTEEVVAVLLLENTTATELLDLLELVAGTDELVAGVELREEVDGVELVTVPPLLAIIALRTRVPEAVS